MQDLGFLGGTAGSENSQALAVSGDGSVITGSSTVTGGSQNAYRWTQATGMIDLGRLAGGSFSSGQGISRDGSVIVGTSGVGGGGGFFHAFRWTSAGMDDLGTLAGGRTSQGKGVSADGSVVVGHSENVNFNQRAFRWTQAGGMQDLGVLGAVTDDSYGLGVSADGQVVVGYAVQGGNDVAFRWTNATGMQSVVDWLGAAGVSTTGVALNEATGTNEDGSVVVGNRQDGSGRNVGWIARVSPLGSGVMNPANYMQSAVTSSQATLQGGQQLGRFILWGAHHRPLMSYGDLGRSCFWATGDLGRRNNPQDAKDMLAETGICGDFVDGKIRAGIGIGHGTRTVGLGEFGSTRLSGNHLVAELNARPTAATLVSATFLHGRWSVDSRRGYQGGAGTDFSGGSSHVDSTALRLRADWEKLWMAGDTPLSPYAAATLSRTRTGAFTETGGGFPARFDAQTQTELESRLGITASHALSPNTTLRPAIEAVYRLDRDAPRVSGQVLGLFAFDQAGAARRRSWLRIGADIDYQLSKSALVSFSLHAATRGDDPRVAGSVTFRMGF